MTSEIIEKFIENTSRKSSIVNIHFKERSTVKGMFIRSSDFDELKMKNLWRVVSNEKIEEWKRTKKYGPSQDIQWTFFHQANR